MNILQNNYASIESMREQLGTSKNISSKLKTNVEEKNGSASFAQVLQQKEQETAERSSLHFSKHANERLASRKIALSTEQVQRLENGTNRAREKGIQESLIMVDSLAFIVNVKNNTVITAVNDVKDAVFTNIDGPVIG